MFDYMLAIWPFLVLTCDLHNYVLHIFCILPVPFASRPSRPCVAKSYSCTVLGLCFNCDVLIVYDHVLPTFLQWTTEVLQVVFRHRSPCLIAVMCNCQWFRFMNFLVMIRAT